MPEPLVSICCLTFNHASFIRQCLDGFLMQKTSFPIEILIHDDASTDGTTDIIREYEQRYKDIIKPVYQTENQYSKGFSIAQLNNILFTRAKGKYIAVCEGDDYWIDSYKLEKQIGFLEKNQEYGFCYTKALTFDQAKKKLTKTEQGGPVRSFSELIHLGNCVPNLTVCFRKDLLDIYLEEIQPDNRNWPVDDFSRTLWFAHNSKIHFIGEATGVYRFLKQSLSHFESYKKEKIFIQSIEGISIFFLERYYPSYDKTNVTIIYLLKLLSASVKFLDYSAFKDNVNKINRLENNRYKKYNIISKSKSFFFIYSFWNSSIKFHPVYVFLRFIYRIMVPKETTMPDFNNFTDKR